MDKEVGAICNGGEIKRIGSKHFCPKCKKKTLSGMQDYYDDVFCIECGNIKGRI